jgi:hypothetical protein
MLSRPQLLHVVEQLEGRDVPGQRDPVHLRTGEDVDVGSDPARLVESPCPHVPEHRARVLAAERDLASRAPPDALRPAVVTRHVHGLRLSREQLDAVGLDQQVDHEGAAGLALTDRQWQQWMESGSDASR